jgi:uncharacterized protein YdhG (YjbR/CyaY superfamily)
MSKQELSLETYIDNLPEDRKVVIEKLRKVIKKNLPKGFKEGISYGMIGYYVPHSIYPDGYHCDPKLPLPFITVASQKNFVAFYHMGMYADATLLEWFTQEYAKRITGKLDMGKSCVRFKKLDQIPYELIGELITKVSVQNWIDTYEKNYKKKK